MDTSRKEASSAGRIARLSTTRRLHIEAGDVVIVGCSTAALLTALELRPMAVTLVSPLPLASLADHPPTDAYGIAAAIADGDSSLAHADDIQRAGAGLASSPVVQALTAGAPAALETLARLGVPLDADPDGRARPVATAGHRAPRLVLAGGESTAPRIVAALVTRIRATPSIRVIEGWEANAIGTADGAVTGVRLAPAGRLGLGSPLDLTARALVLADGGIGRLFARTTTGAGANAGSLGLAVRAGALAVVPELVQFHPVAVAGSGDPLVPAPEVLRGLGATLVTGRGERFMPRLHEQAELAPDDVVARAVQRQIDAGHGALLDCRKVLAADDAPALPGFIEACHRAGVDPLTAPVPIVAAAGRHLGGLAVDIRGRTTLDGLWAAGELAATGLDGASALPGQALLAAVALAGRIAEDLKGREPYRDLGQMELPDLGWATGTSAAGPREQMAIELLRQTMTAALGALRNAAAMTEALGVLQGLAVEHARVPQIANGVLAAKLITLAALARRESRGCHVRADFPSPRPGQTQPRAWSLDTAQRATEEILETARVSKVTELRRLN